MGYLYVKHYFYIKQGFLQSPFFVPTLFTRKKGAMQEIDYPGKFQPEVNG
jgi:hypothetical protein